MDDKGRKDGWDFAELDNNQIVGAMHMALVEGLLVE